MKADNYEFPFDIVLQGSLPESVEGLNDTWIIYRFKAEIGRKYAKDILIRKPLRIIRTLDPSALELAHAMVREALSDRAVLMRIADHMSRLWRTYGPTRSNTPSARLPKPSSSAPRSE